VTFLEDHARLILVVHTALAVGAVAASTHVVVWMRGYLRGDYRRHRGVQRLTLYAALLFLGAFIAGNLMYPTYRVRVRAEYLDDGGAVIRDRAARLEARGETPAAADPDRDAHLPRTTAKIGRWFDVKEHWLALGLLMAAASALLARAWDPRRGGAAIAPAAFAIALGAALTGWVGAIIGVVVSSYRAVGGLG
jgi:hypothetical protein